MSIESAVGRLFTRTTAQETERKVANAARVLPKVKPVAPAAAKQAADRLVLRQAAEKKLQLPNAKGIAKLENHDEMLLRLQPSPEQAKGTVLMFHGYTAGPWQYDELADKLSADGYNVYAPRLPGHGVIDQRTGMNTNAKFIHAANREDYQKYVEQRFKEAADLGAPVYTLGLSGGTNLALLAAEKHPEVRGVFAMAPFLGPNRPTGFLYDTLRFLDKITFGLFGKLMDLIPQEKNVKARLDNMLPHTESTFGEALAIEQVGEHIKNVQAPVQFVTTAGDPLSGNEIVKPLYERLGGASKNGWYHFAPEDGVPHPMVTRLQNHAPGAVDKIDQMVMDFVHGERTMRRPGDVTG